MASSSSPIMTHYKHLVLVSGHGVQQPNEVTDDMEGAVGGWCGCNGEELALMLHSLEKKGWRHIFVIYIYIYIYIYIFHNFNILY